MKKLTDITIVLDRSGSMGSIVEETICGYNSFIKELRFVKGKARITLVQFDHEYQPIYEGIDITEAQFLDKNSYVPRGLTALLDAIGKTIRSTKDRLKHGMESTDTHVIFVIITDGYENHSCLYNRNQIFKKISKLQTHEKWEFVFLGANQDSIEEAGRIGIGKKKAFAFSADGAGVNDMFNSVCFCIAECREKDVEFSFSDEQRLQKNRKN